MSLKEKYREYLIKKGYKQVTPSGRDSTVPDYLRRIDGICEWENITWEKLYENIEYYCSLYEYDGPKSDLGAKSHNAYISALRRFNEFKASES